MLPVVLFKGSGHIKQSNVWSRPLVLRQHDSSKNHSSDVALCCWKTGAWASNGSVIYSPCTKQIHSSLGRRGTINVYWKTPYFRLLSQLRHRSAGCLKQVWKPRHCSRNNREWNISALDLREGLVGMSVCIHGFLSLHPLLVCRLENKQWTSFGDVLATISFCKSRIHIVGRGQTGKEWAIAFDQLVI